jgi:hypothetical protein
MDHRPWYLVLGFILAACAAELTLMAFPVSTGYHLGGVDEAHPISLGEPYFRYTYSRDWNFHLHNSGTLNNFGLRASYDYHPDPGAVVVIGNSFVQADALDPRDTLQERMAAQLHRSVYGLGVDGFSLADYLAAARWAAATFDSHTLVVLLTTGDLDHSCSLRSGQHYLRLAAGDISQELIRRETPSRFKQWLNNSRLFRYIFDNLKVTANWSKGWERGGPEGPPGGASNARVSLGCAAAPFEAAATEFLLRSFRELETERRVHVIFLLAPGYRREQSLEPGAVRDVDRFAASAAHDGFGVVSLQPAFAAALGNGTRLDFLPIDGHWNAAAHAIAARVCAEALAPMLQSRADSMTRISSPAFRSE